MSVPRRSNPGKARQFALNHAKMRELHGSVTNERAQSPGTPRAEVRVRRAHMSGYNVIEADGGLIKAWTKGVAVEASAERQLKNIAGLPFIHKWVAAMPDVHLGMGATVGSVIPTVGAIVPAAVGVDLGCGMIATRTDLRAEHLPDSLGAVRAAIERAVPHGRSSNGGRGDRGAWNSPPDTALTAWRDTLDAEFEQICDKHPTIRKSNNLNHLGTLGTGNHFIEVCLDEAGAVWVMLHSGSRGVGNRIGSTFIRLARKEMERWHIRLPDRDLAYLPEGTQHFDDYVRAVGWAQRFAATNRGLMLQQTLSAMRQELGPFRADLEAVNCHHNYVARETHYGQAVWVTRKGAVRAGKGELGIIPGSMGARSYIVRGKGNPESFCSCSHGAGRAMSRTAAKNAFTV
ncbi:MAG: tRNA-splicing ligase RtcB, partial [Myxococcota bacterium]